MTLVARRADRLETLAAELRGRGVRAEVLAADLAERSERAIAMKNHKDSSILREGRCPSSSLIRLPAHLMPAPSSSASKA